eukprot:15333948-Ditylum_brightwellii.AAC.1
MHNRNPTPPLDADELLDILEYGVPASWCREFTVQGFDPVDQGLQKIFEFCTCLESCEPSKGKPKGEKPSKLKTAGKRKAKVLTTTTPSVGTTMFQCKMHGPNRTHDTKDCYELNQRNKRAKLNTSHNGADKVTYKDLNAFINAKVTAALKKAKSNNRKKGAKKLLLMPLINFVT